MGQRLLMIEDDRRLAGMVSEYLGRSGFSVARAEDAEQGLAALRRESFDLVLLDLMLPDADGLDLCRRIRSEAGVAPAIPIVMVTGRGEPADRIVGLELGADDYVSKPFEPREQLARIRAVLRRSQNTDRRDRAAVLGFGRLAIDLDARVARVDGAVRSLTSYQLELLAAMAKSAGRVLSREQLMEITRPHQPAHARRGTGPRHRC